MRIEIHVLQNFAPANLNRDDVGSPKDAEFGGHRRARVSSQCGKRAIREYFKAHELIPAANRAIRTKRLLEYVGRKLAKPGRDEAAISRAITSGLAAGGLKIAEKNLTQYLLFLGEDEIKRFTELVEKHFDALSSKVIEAAPVEPGKRKSPRKDKAEAKSAAPQEVQKAVPDLLDGGKAADLALFGRMLSDTPVAHRGVNAACQVAHAISTNKIHSMEMDYYTAVDDINNDTPGADMIGTVEFNSACFYRYANLDLGQLRENLQDDDELVRKSVDAFLRAFIHAIPSGKQNSFAAHNPPSLVFAVVRSGPPVSLANAFVDPARADHTGGLVINSVRKLDRYYQTFVPLYGKDDRKAGAMWCEYTNEDIWAMKKGEKSEQATSTLKDFRRPDWDEVIAAVTAAAFDGKEAK